MIDHIITDIPNAGFFGTYISDNILESMTDVDHRAINAISKLEMKTPRKSLVKIFDKSTDNTGSFEQSVIMGDWLDFYAQNRAEGM